MENIRKAKLCALNKLQKSIVHKLAEPNFPKQPEKFVRNLSSVALNELQLPALSCGLRFCIPPSKINSIETQAQFEYLFEQLKIVKPTSEDADTWFKA